MGALTRIVYLRMGQHASSSDWTTDPSSYKFVEPMEGWVYEGSYEEIERPLEREDGMPYASLQGRKRSGLRSLQVPLKGINGGAGDGVSTSASTKADITHDLLTMLTGRAVSDASGNTESGVAASSGTTLETTDSAYAAGDAVLVTGGTSSIAQARFLTAVSGTSNTMCRSLTTRTGVAEDPENASVVYAGAVYQLDHDAGDHIHLGADVETQIGRRKINGLLGNATINFPAGGLANFQLDLSGTDWSAPATATPTFSAPTAGNHVRVINTFCWVGSSLYMSNSASFDFGIEVQPRVADEAPNGNWGFKVTAISPVLRVRMHYGSLTAPTQVTDSVLQTWQGGTTQDVLFQCGTAAGETIAIRLPDARVVVGDPVRDNGQWMLDVEFRGTRPAGGSSAGELGAAQIALF